MADYHEANDTANKEILQKLSERCDDAEVAAVLSCYTIGATGADIRKELNKHKLPQLKKAANFLSVLADGDTQKKKAQIIVDIMSKLNILLKDVCGVCGDYYSNDLEDHPAFSCLICRQGCHDKCFGPVSTLFRGLDANYRKSMQFVCTTCYSDHTPDDEEIVLNAKKSPMKAKPPTQEELVEEDKEEETLPPDIAPKIPNKEEEFKQTPGTEPHPINVNPPPADNPPKKPMCPQYEHGRCMNYETCKSVYDHPRRCRNMLTFGKCRFGNRCIYHHPKICSDSLYQKKCTNLDCKFFHLRYTQRYGNLSEAVEAEGRPPWHPPAQPRSQQRPGDVNRYQSPSHVNHPPAQPCSQQSQGDGNRNQPPAQENHFLYQHITETNNTMKQLQSLITNLLNTQQGPQPPANQNATLMVQPQIPPTQPPQQLQPPPHHEPPQTQPPQQLQPPPHHEPPQNHQQPQHLQPPQHINHPYHYPNH